MRFCNSKANTGFTGQYDIRADAASSFRGKLSSSRHRTLCSNVPLKAEGFSSMGPLWDRGFHNATSVPGLRSRCICVFFFPFFFHEWINTLSTKARISRETRQARPRLPVIKGNLQDSSMGLGDCRDGVGDQSLLGCLVQHCAV